MNQSDLISAIRANEAALKADGVAVPPLKARLSHVLDAIAQIEKNTKGTTLQELQRDRFRQLGIERCLEIISEASRYIPDDVKLRYDEVPWRRIADIGNRCGTLITLSTAPLSGRS